MNKKKVIGIIVAILILALVIWFVASRHENLETDEEFTNEMTATVMTLFILLVILKVMTF